MEEIERLFEMTPAGDLTDRRQRLQARMAARGIELAILFQNVDIFYFTGTLQKGFLLIPAEGPELFLVQKSWDRAKLESPVRMVPARSLKDVAEQIKELDLEGARRIGLEFDVLPMALFLRLRDLLGERDYVDIAPDILKVRACKSAFEIAQIQRSGDIVAHVFRQVPVHLREGMSEIELNALVYAEGRRVGHQGFLRMRGLNQEMENIFVLAGKSAACQSYADVPLCGYGTTHAIAQGASNRAIRRNEPIIVDYGGGFNGYITDETRIFVLGELPAHLSRAYDAAVEVMQAFEGQAHAGANGRDLFALCREVAERSGLGSHFMGHGQGQVKFVGHGLGLEINELPIIAERRDEVLEEGMVFAFEPKFVFPGEGAVGVEVDYIVRAEGLERTTDIPPIITYL